MPTRRLAAADYPCSCGRKGGSCPQLLVRECLIDRVQAVHLTLTPSLGMKNGMILNRDQAVHLANLLLTIIRE